MRLRSRLEAIERRQSPTGECACNGSEWGETLYCRDPRVPPPPPTLCTRCGRPKSRLLVRMGNGPDGRPPEPDPRHADRPAYEPIGADGIRRLICGLDPAATDPDDPYGSEP